jgi:DNA-binding LacI/PurR family transcriptional regulator
MDVTIRELAKLAGVSICTVSKALQNNPRISAATRQRIQQLAKAHLYSPNRITQRLVTGITKTIGCIVPDLTSTFHARLVRGVLTGVAQFGYHLLIVETHNVLHETVQAMTAQLEQRVDGILVVSEHFAPIPRQIIYALRSHGIALIGLDATRFASPVDCVRTDEDALAIMAVGYLADLGHREIAYVGPMPGKPLIDRSEAMVRAFAAHKLATEHFLDTQTDRHDSFDAEAVLKRLCRGRKRVTAIIAWEDRIAARLVQAAAVQRINVPGTLSILGCANFEIADLTVPRLTTIEQSPEAIGRQGAELLLRRLENREMSVDQETETVLTQPRLILRASCASP